MKIQSLAVMFIILILPISLVLSTYVQNRVETLSLQTQYDSKLKSATYDALKAYQLNSFNSDTSYLVNSKMRDIKASVNTFFSSLATNFSTVGYTKETLQNYVPAVVYTMYDGYYMYSPYTNTWDKETINKHSEDKSYKNKESLYGLKPYVYYSCRYKRGNNTDVVITYSLDNYISIQGTVNKVAVSKYGYLLSNVENENENGKVSYNDITIDNESILKENVCVDGQINEYQYVKRNGVKYYKSLQGDEKVFNVVNGKSVVQSDFQFPNTDDSAKNYYLESLEMQKFIKEYGLDKLTVNDAVDVTGNKFNNNSPFTNLDGKEIFDFDHIGGIEAEDSNFNTHRIDVIKYSIERNLSVAISNYNNYSAVSGVDFQMPKLKDTDWDKIIDNISIISFLQGMNIGGKVYNGYSIITNTKNMDVVTEDSIYIKTSDKVIHRVTENGLENNIKEEATGIFNVDTERRTGEDENGTSIYFYPKDGTLSYDSIVTQNSIAKESEQTLQKYLKGKTELAKIYYTALGRERYCMYKEKLSFDAKEQNTNIKEVQLGSYVKYNYSDGEILCRILYNYGIIQIVSNDITEIAKIDASGVDEKQVEGNFYRGYGSFKDTFTNKYSTEYSETVRFIESIDYYQLEQLKIKNVGKSYWIEGASNISGVLQWNYINSAGEIRQAIIYNYMNKTGYSYEYGIRPVIKLKSDVKIVSGDGTSANPYVLGK